MKDVFNLLIIDKESGLCVFKQDFEDLPNHVDPEIMGGFFTAMMCFSRRIAEQEIKYIQLEGIRFYFHVGESIALISATKNSVKLGTIKSFLQRVHDKFEKKYKEVINSGELNETRLFASFAVEIEEEIGKKTRRFEYFNRKSKPEQRKYELMRDNFIHLKDVIHKQARLFKDHMRNARVTNLPRTRKTKQDYFDDYKN
ncbi:MAG: hypothetical protein ACTSUE_03285 [Promethearchaeota archaeon]